MRLLWRREVIESSSLRSLSPKFWDEEVKVIQRKKMCKLASDVKLKMSFIPEYRRGGYVKPHACTVDI